MKPSSTRFRSVIWCLAATVWGLSGPSLAQDTPPPTVIPDAPISIPSVSGDAFLATEFFRSAGIMLGGANMTVESLDTAMRLTRAGLKHAPDDPDGWRLLLGLATLGEDRETQREAVDQIARLNPEDRAIRVRKLVMALDSAQTAATRAALYERLLAPDQRQRVGEPESSRLAYEYALLQRRRGDEEGFARWLAESVAIDPSNRAAAALATGYFRMKVDDPFAEAELLVTLLLADPTDVSSMATLARLLLEHGAYRGAARFYSMANNAQLVMHTLPTSGLVSDLAIAHWGAGQPESAVRAIRSYQFHMSELLRNQARRANPDLKPSQLSRLRYKLDGPLAAVQCVLMSAEGHRDGELAVTYLQASFDEAMKAFDEIEGDATAMRAQLRLNYALMLLWLDAPGADQVPTLLSEAEAHLPLNDAARARFDGWMALRADRIDEAILLLTPFAETDGACGLGLAEALLAKGLEQEAARALLSVARIEPGTLIGAAAATRLHTLLDRRVPLTPLARRLEELVASIPGSVDRYPERPSLAVSVSVEAAQRTYEALEPIIVNVTLRNTSPFRLAIDRDGPIRPHVMLRVEVAGLRRVAPPRPVVIDIDRRLALDPGETMTIPVDLRRTPAGRVFNELILGGTMAQVTVMTNVQPTIGGGFEPGLLGVESDTGTFRVNGVRLSPEWIREAIASLATESPDRVSTLVFLSRAIHQGFNFDIDETLQAAVDEILPAITEAFPTLTSIEQACALSMMSASDVLQPVTDLARKSTSSDVLLVFLIYQIAKSDDPMFAACQRGDDEDLKAIAAYLEGVLARTEAAARAASAESPGR